MASGLLPTKNRRASSTAYSDLGYGKRRPGISFERTSVPPVSALWEGTFHTRFGVGVSSSTGFVPLTEPSLLRPVTVMVPSAISAMVPVWRYWTVPFLLTRTNPFLQFRRNTSGVNPHSISVPSGFSGQTAMVPLGAATESLSTSSGMGSPMEWMKFVSSSTKIG